MRNKSESPAPSRRSIAYQVLRKAYSSGPLSHSEYATSLSVRRYFGVVFKAIVLLIALAMLLPLAYLLYRAAGVGWTQAVDLLARMRTVQIMWNSLILVCGVTTLSLALALPFAWLTERTDLPGWRIWTVLAMMPLVIPSYVGGFALIAMFGPRGRPARTPVPLWSKPPAVNLRFHWRTLGPDTFYLSLHLHEHSRRVA